MNLAAAIGNIRSLGEGLDERPGEVRLELGEQVARLVIDNPLARNALTVAMMLQLAEAVQALSNWNGAAVVLSSTGERVFCAGGHLGEVRASLATAERGYLMSRAMSLVLDTLLDLPIVSVAAVDGAAIGGGAELITACDLRVLGAEASVHFVHSRLGVATGWGGASRLVRHLGRKTALEIVHQARYLDAQTVLALGLADRVVEGPAEQGALDLLGDLEMRSTAALRALKGQVVAADRLPPEEAQGAQAELFAEVWGGPDHQAALEALRKNRGSKGW